MPDGKAAAAAAAQGCAAKLQRGRRCKRWRWRRQWRRPQRSRTWKLRRCAAVACPASTAQVTCTRKQRSQLPRRLWRQLRRTGQKCKSLRNLNHLWSLHVQPGRPQVRGGQQPNWQKQTSLPASWAPPLASGKSGVGRCSARRNVSCSLHLHTGRARRRPAAGTSSGRRAAPDWAGLVTLRFTTWADLGSS